MKAVNQLLAGIHICAAAEATAFAKKKGMDLDAVYAVVSKGAASSYCMKDRKWTSSSLRILADCIRWTTNATEETSSLERHDDVCEGSRNRSVSSESGQLSTILGCSGASAVYQSSVVWLARCR